MITHSLLDFFERWLTFFLYSIFFLLFFSYIASTHDPDFGWHLLVGEEIVSTWAMPQPEHVLYPIFGTPWIDHEWLSNAILYLIYDSGTHGDIVLSLIFALCATATLFLIQFIATRWFFDTTQKRPQSTLVLFSLFQFFTATILLPFSGIRLQMLSWIFFLTLIAILLWFLEKRKSWILWLVPCLILIWANTHGSFFLGLVGYLLSAFAITFFLVTSLREKAHFFFVGIVALLATLCTPYTTDLWRLLLVEYTQNNFYKTHLAEWLPVYLVPPFDTSSFQIFPLALLLLLLLSRKHLFSLWIFKHYPKLLLPFFLGWGALGIFYIEHRRHAPFFLFITLLVLLPLAVKNFNLEKIPRAILFSPVLLILLWGGIQGTTKMREIPSDPFSVAYAPATPKGAVDFLKAHESTLKPLRIFNYYSWGGYLEWTLPGWLIFVDGRFPQMPIPHKTTSYIEEYYRFFENASSLEKAVSEYRVELILLNTNWEIHEEKLPFPWRYILSPHITRISSQTDDWLYTYLTAHWEVLYSDDMSTLFYKKALQ